MIEFRWMIRYKWRCVACEYGIASGVARDHSKTWKIRNNCQYCFLIVLIFLTFDSFFDVELKYIVFLFVKSLMSLVFVRSDYMVMIGLA